jgi:hypothetical protein
MWTPINRSANVFGMSFRNTGRAENRAAATIAVVVSAKQDSVSVSSRSGFSQCPAIRKRILNGFANVLVEVVVHVSHS